jgi:hypothetical protein
VSGVTPPWEPSDRLCLGVIAVFAAIFFFPLLAGRAFLWEDFLYAWYPYRQFAAVSLANGELPLWNPYTFNGMPFLADIQMQVFYLPITALTLFVRDGHLGVYWIELMNILHYPVAGAGMYFLARSFRTGRLPSLFAGVTFMLSGFMVTHAIHQVVITLVAWYPWILLLFRRVIAESSWRWVFGAALLLGHTFFAGFPQLSLFLYLFLGAFLVFELLTTFRGRALISGPAMIVVARAAAVVLLSVGVTLVQLLPTLEMSRLAIRAEISFAKATEGSFAWGQIITFLFPGFYGTAGASGYNYWGGTYWYYWETCVYLGVLPLFLSLLSLRLLRVNKYVAFFAGYAVFSILFALGGNFVVQKFFFDYVPGFATFRNPARMTVFVALGVALLSAFFLQYLQQSSGSATVRRHVTRDVLIIAGVGCGIWVLAMSGALQGVFAFLSQPQVFSAVKAQLMIGLTFLVLSAVILTVMVRRPSPMVLLVATTFLFVDLYVFGADQNTASVNPEDHFARAGSIVRFLKSQPGIFRVNTRNADGMIMDRNQGMVDRVFMMEGYTPLVLQRIHPPMENDQALDVLNVQYKTVTDTGARSLRLEPHPTALPRLFFVYRAAVAKSDDEVMAITKNPEFRPDSVAVLEKEPGSPLDGSSPHGVWKAQITHYSNNRIEAEVETAARGLLMFSEMYYPDWHATVDGVATEVYRTDYSFRGIVVDAGRHTVVMRYEPSAFRVGAIGTGATVALCLIGLSLSFRRNRPPGTEVSPS